MESAYAYGLTYKSSEWDKAMLARIAAQKAKIQEELARGELITGNSLGAAAASGGSGGAALTRTTSDGSGTRLEVGVPVPVHFEFERSSLAQQKILEESGAASGYYHGAGGNMDGMRGTTASSQSSTSSQAEAAYQRLLSNPFELRHGRRYLRDGPYPLPCDLAEMQRQNLRTLLGCRVFAGAVCAPHLRQTHRVPRRVLELGCGSAFWSAQCHDYFTSLGHSNVSFTGLDFAPLAPDLSRSGMDWTFVQHDIRRTPLPFDDEEFDLIMLKDMSLAVQIGAPFQTLVDEMIRLLAEGGTLEIWDSDYVLRSLLPHPPAPASKKHPDYRTAEKTATFLIAPGTPFAPAQNKHLSRANAWIQEALDAKKLPPMPCARTAQILLQEPSLEKVGNRRVAIPLGELRWERDNSYPSNHHGAVDSPMMSTKGKHKLGDSGGALTEDQIALRHTALITVLQFIESLEPLLKEVSGKNSEEWSHWWATMMSDLLSPSGKDGPQLTECLELGAWWATKVRSS